MKALPLSRGLVALVDDQDFEFLNQWKWTAVKGCGTFYAMRRPWDKLSKKYSHIYLHRLMLAPPHGLLVDHIDGNGLNNQRLNLRVATETQNRINQRFSSRNNSGHRGVCYSKAAKKWQAQIVLNRKARYLGLFDSPEDAAQAYKVAAAEMFGEYFTNR